MVELVPERLASPILQTGQESGKESEALPPLILMDEDGKTACQHQISLDTWRRSSGASLAPSEPEGESRLIFWVLPSSPMAAGILTAFVCL